MKTKFLSALLLQGCLLISPASAQSGGVVIADTTYSAPVMLSARLTAVGSLTFASTLDGAHSLVVAGDLVVRGDVGAIVPLADLTIAGRWRCETDLVRCTGVVSAAGTTELRAPGSVLSAGSWVLDGRISLVTAGTYTIRATQRNIVLVGQLVGPASGTATLRLIAPQGTVTIGQAVPANITVQTILSEPPSDPGAGRFLNISTRGCVGTGDAVMIAGFVISEGGHAVLVRAVGPSLTRFGVAGVLQNPTLEIVDAQEAIVATQADWTSLPAATRAEVENAALAVGAFPLTENAPDAALVARLPAGAYTMIVRGQNLSTGIALAEVYELD